MITTNDARRPHGFAGNLFSWPVTTPDVAVADVIARPGGEPALHVHANEDETYVVLDGALTFQRGEERFDAQAGDVVFLPRGVVHGFALRTPTARLLVVCTPGGLDAPFRALATPAEDGELPPLPDGPPSPEQIAAFEATFGAYGVTFVGPPLPALLADA